MGADCTVFDRNVLPHGGDAKNDQERAAVFNSLLAQCDRGRVGKIQRIEPPGGGNSYALWIYSRAVAQSEAP
jgi:hypothetical protein